MDKSKLSLASVKLVNGGMKGVEVEYLLPSIKNNIKFLDLYKSKRKAPIHAELEECFSWLKPYMLDICGYTLEKEEREYLLGSLQMTGVKYGDKGIILMGELSVLGGDKSLLLETPLISNQTDFPEFGKLVSIIDGIYTETADYLAGKKVMSDVQFVTRFNAKNEEFDIESFKKMTKQEQRDIATKILEDQKCIVIHNDDFTVGEDDDVFDSTITEATPSVKEETIEPEPEIAPVPVMQEAPALELPKKREVITLEMDDDFALPIAAKTTSKKSTAKRKTA